MKILEIIPLPIPDVKVIRFGRFPDSRGYFTESFRGTDITAANGLEFLEGREFVQINESCSRAGVIRGLHFQWSPPMGKLVRTVSGRMVDLALDIRPGSPTLGKIVACELEQDLERDWDEWIWVPPGFAHGNYFTVPTRIEYLCTGGYNPECEAGIGPLDQSLDWGLCDRALAAEYRALAADGALLSDKDRDAGSLAEWLARPESEVFKL